MFFMRQYLVQALPDELIEAARVDGASSLRVVWHVVFPAARPAMAVLGHADLREAWNDFFWPIIALTQTATRPCRSRCAGSAAATSPTSP